MIETKHIIVRAEALNFCPEDCKYREIDNDNCYSGDEIVAKYEYCTYRKICKNAAEAYEDFKKKEEERKTEEKRNELLNVINEFKFR